MNSMTFKNMCTPAKIYFVLTIVATILAILNNVPITAVFIKLMFALGWTFVLNWICRKGMKEVSWFLVVFPYILIMTGYACMKYKTR